MLLFCMYLDARSARAGGPRGIERPKAKGRTGKGKGRGIRYPREFDLARVAGEKQTPKAKSEVLAGTPILRNHHQSPSEARHGDSCPPQCNRTHARAAHANTGAEPQR